MIWLWGQGHAPSLSAFSVQHGVSGTIISAVDLLRGIARLAGLRAPRVPGATGRLDTNWRGKADAARTALAEDDFVFVHVEAPDECGHQADLEGKVRAIELTDREIIGPVWEAAQPMMPRVSWCSPITTPHSLCARTSANRSPSRWPVPVSMPTAPIDWMSRWARNRPSL